MRPLALLLTVIGLNAAIQCPSGYKDWDNTGHCYSPGTTPYPSQYSRFDGYKLCAKDSATLAIMRNAADNMRIYSYYYNNVWLALTCLSTDPQSCVWDDGTPANYTSFAPGHPNPLLGACVYEVGIVPNSPNVKLWFSAPCTSTKAGVVCQYTTGAQVPQCADGSVYFRGNCYLGVMASNVNDEINKCREDCGDMASIHSDGENSLVYEVARFLEPTNYTFLGLSQSGSRLSWSDNSGVNYTNFGYQNAQLGSCVEMALTDTLIKKGQWINSPCSSTSVVNMVCKKNVTNDCDKIFATPAKCTSSYFLSDAGTVLSPGYPTNNNSNNCQYLVTVASGLRASIRFTELQVNSTNKIALFNTIFESTPFATITSSSSLRQTYVAAANSLVISFTSNGASGVKFRGTYGPGLPPCPGPDYYYGSGNFSTPNYPSNYGSGLNCEYRLLSTKNRIVVQFLDYNTSNDIVYVVDGNGSQLARLYSTQGNQTVSSFTGSVRVVLTTHSSAKGFNARFISIM